MRVLIAEHDHPVYAQLLREAAPDLEVLTSGDSAELARQAYEQAWVFGTHFVTGCEVCGLEVEDDCYVLCTTEGGRIAARSVVLATGVTYNRLTEATLEQRVSLLRAESLDPDMLDERARFQLEFAHPRDLVRMTGQN